MNEISSSATVTIDPAFVAQLEHRAEAGEVKAMFDLACLYDVPVKGGVELDLHKAFHWYSRAAGEGHAWAQFALGNMMELAQGTSRNDLAARQWYEAASAQGIAEAQMHLARMLQAGRGGPADLSRAVELYERAAAQGHEQAATNLALLHLQGTVPAADPAKALDLLTFAADKLDGLAHLVLGDLHLQGTLIQRHGGIALMHYCVASRLLTAGPDARRAVDGKERLLARQPQLRQEYESQAQEFVDSRAGAAAARFTRGHGEAGSSVQDES